jgi:L-fuconolactonase
MEVWFLIGWTRENAVTKKIDAHHHLWKYSREGYGWIDDAMTALRRDFLPVNLAEATHAAGVEGTVVVQASQTLEETRWLLDLAEESELIRGVVGWAPFAGGLETALEEFEGTAKLKGLRHVVQGEPDENFILRDDFNRGIRALEETGLVYDILIFERHLPQTIKFVDRHPNQKFVLDHVAKPRIREGVLEPWSANMRELARRENVWCKVSGMVTEADWKRWSLQGLRPYLDVVVEAFGPRRIMAGSDWPVCLVASEYKQWFDALEEYFAGFSPQERAAIFAGTAERVYML